MLHLVRTYVDTHLYCNSTYYKITIVAIPMYKLATYVLYMYVHMHTYVSSMRTYVYIIMCVHVSPINFECLSISLRMSTVYA